MSTILDSTNSSLTLKTSLKKNDFGEFELRNRDDFDESEHREKGTCGINKITLVNPIQERGICGINKTTLVNLILEREMCVINKNTLVNPILKRDILTPKKILW